MKRLKVYIHTLGCSKNDVDSERMLRQLQYNNFIIRKSAKNADVVLINTCGFIQDAKTQSIEAILNAVSLKKEGFVKKVMVMGCLSERYKGDLEKEIPEVDKYFGVERYEEVVKELNGVYKEELLGERMLLNPTHTAYLKISEGCNNPCSFCAIPLMRGKHKSRTIELLIEEGRFLAEKGTKELIIIAQDTTDYGKDIYGERNIAKLLNELSKIDGIEWIRLMYAYPSHFPESLIDEIAQNPKICKYLDMPLQHISDRVLKSMRRGISRRRTEELLEKLRRRIPELVLRTTFIVGYPDETEKDFMELVDFVRETKFDKLGVFTYSHEEDTIAFGLKDRITEKEKEKREGILMKEQQKVSLLKNEALVGREFKLLIDSIDKREIIGRLYRDAPEIDSEVIIESGEKTNNRRVGDFVDVIINDFDEYDLFATFK